MNPAAAGLITLRPRIIASSIIVFSIAVAVIVTNSVITYNINETQNQEKSNEERLHHLEVAYKWAWTSDIVAIIVAAISGIVGGVAIGSYFVAP